MSVIVKRWKNKVKNCKLCGGTGRKPTKESIFQDCDCVKSLKHEIIKYKAGIPRRYWDFKWKDIEEDFYKKNKGALNWVKQYIKDVKNFEDINPGFWIASNPGLGKTSILTFIVYQANKYKRSAYYIKCSDLFELKLSREHEDRQKYRDLLNTCELICLDEMDKMYLNAEYPEKKYNELILELYDSGAALGISTNMVPNEFLKSLPPFVRDRLKTLKLLYFRGKSHREIDQAWE